MNFACSFSQIKLLTMLWLRAGVFPRGVSGDKLRPHSEREDSCTLGLDAPHMKCILDCFFFFFLFFNALVRRSDHGLVKNVLNLLPGGACACTPAGVKGQPRGRRPKSQGLVLARLASGTPRWRRRWFLNSSWSPGV